MLLFRLKIIKGVHYPNVNFNSYCFSPPPLRRSLNRAASREILVEKIGNKNDKFCTTINNKFM